MRVRNVGYCMTFPRRLAQGILLEPWAAAHGLSIYEAARPGCPSHGGSTLAGLAGAHRTRKMGTTGSHIPVGPHTLQLPLMSAADKAQARRIKTWITHGKVDAYWKSHRIAVLHGPSPIS